MFDAKKTAFTKNYLLMAPNPQNKSLFKPKSHPLHANWIKTSTLAKVRYFFAKILQEIIYIAICSQNCARIWKVRDQKTVFCRVGHRICRANVKKVKQVDWKSVVKAWKCLFFTHYFHIKADVWLASHVLSNLPDLSY